jgi:hypothetical protein
MRACALSARSAQSEGSRETRHLARARPAAAFERAAAHLQPRCDLRMRGDLSAARPGEGERDAFRDRLELLGARAADQCVLDCSQAPLVLRFVIEDSLVILERGIVAFELGQTLERLASCGVVLRLLDLAMELLAEAGLVAEGDLRTGGDHRRETIVTRFLGGLRGSERGGVIADALVLQRGLREEVRLRRAHRLLSARLAPSAAIVGLLGCEALVELA